MDKTNFENSYMAIVHDASVLGPKLHAQLVDTSGYQQSQISIGEAGFSCKLLLAALERTGLVTDIDTHSQELREAILTIAKEIES